MDKIPVVIVGARGKKLGEPVGKAIAESEDIETIAEVVRPGDERPSSWCEVQFHSFAGPWIDRRGMPYTRIHDAVVFYAVKGEDLGNLLLESARAGFRKHVIGSTAVPKHTEDHIRHKVAEGNFILHVPNFSEEAVLADWLGEQVALALPDHGAGIRDIHHDQKKDVPSGTARMMAENISRMRPSVKVPEVAALRIGGVPGEHEIIFAGPYATLTITQRAYSSQSFAAGALRAIRWMARQRAPGLYNMRDVLGLPKMTIVPDAPFCDVCGHITARNGACWKCLNCGNSMGCS